MVNKKMEILKKRIKELAKIIYDPQNHEFPTPFDEATGNIKISDLNEIRELLIEYYFVLSEKEGKS